VSREELFLAVGAILAVLGAIRLLLTRDLMTRVLALNVASAGVLMILIALAVRSGGAGGPDSVLHALVLTGIVITVSVTGLAIGLVRRIERHRSGGGGR
jgi:multicomponent Na+:H+ antiporter subunit C